MDINRASGSNRIGQVASSPQNTRTTPTTRDVDAFNQAMSAELEEVEVEEKNEEISNSFDNSEHLTDMIPVDTWQRLIELIQEMMDITITPTSGITSSMNTLGGSTTGLTERVIPVNGSGVGGSAGNNEVIPKPTEHLQTLNLGGKNFTVGGDGTSSAEEVAATANQIQHLYNNSPTFKNMIDTSSDPSFEVSVGRRSDNTSWGNTDGRVFMNINNVSPSNNDNFQSLMGHEFAHASIDMLHGNSMEQTESAVAREA